MKIMLDGKLINCPGLEKLLLHIEETWIKEVGPLEEVDDLARRLSFFNLYFDDSVPLNDFIEPSEEGVILCSKRLFLDYQYFTSSSEWLICSLQDLVVADPSSQSDIGDNVVEQHHKCNGFPKPPKP